MARQGPRRAPSRRLGRDLGPRAEEIDLIDGTPYAATLWLKPLDAYLRRPEVERLTSRGSEASPWASCARSMRAPVRLRRPATD
jgi:hypothetical protein